MQAAIVTNIKHSTNAEKLVRTLQFCKGGLRCEVLQKAKYMTLTVTVVSTEHQLYQIIPKSLTPTVIPVSKMFWLRPRLVLSQVFLGEILHGDIGNSVQAIGSVPHTLWQIFILSCELK